jgi:hypothetical protein
LDWKRSYCKDREEGEIVGAVAANNFLNIKEKE